MASFSTWCPHRNRVLETRFISPYITKQHHQQKRNQSQKEKKKKAEDEEKKLEKIRPTQAARAWQPRSRKPSGLGRAISRPRLREPQAARTLSLSLSLIWSNSFFLSDLVSLSLIWLSLSLWSDPIQWGEAV